MDELVLSILYKLGLPLSWYQCQRHNSLLIHVHVWYMYTPYLSKYKKRSNLHVWSVCNGVFFRKKDLSKCIFLPFVFWKTGKHPYKCMLLKTPNWFSISCISDHYTCLHSSYFRNKCKYCTCSCVKALYIYIKTCQSFAVT